jgi:competence protein ComEA
MQQLGIPQWIANRIVHYREKWGKFRKKEDLAKIYGFPDELYPELEPYIVINLPENIASAPTPALYDAGGTSIVSSKNYQNKSIPLVDINRSSLEDWMALPGIGETRARMIVKFREKLGGFLSVEQVSETKGLPDSIFQRIQSSLLHQYKEIRKININAADQESLDAHPYISSKQASLIFAHRDQNGYFKNIDDLLKLPAFFDRSWLEKVRPYLTLE